MKKAILFDMDGLMIDSEKVTFHYYCEVFKERGYPFDLEMYKRFLGKHRVQVMALIDHYYGDDFPTKEIWDEIHVRFQEHMRREVPLKEGLLPLVHYLKEHNYKTIVATSSDRWRVDEIFNSAKIGHLFDDVVCGNEVERGKPNPDIFLKACEKLNVSIEEAIVLEDSEAGIEAAYRANIDCICIPDLKYPEEEYACKPVCILSSLQEVITYLEK